MPGKSGVSGGIVTVAPGKGGLATFSPPLDAAGNSVRGQLVTKYLAERTVGLNLFALRTGRSARPRTGPPDWSVSPGVVSSSESCRQAD